MIVFLYGRDSYRLKQNLEKIIAEYRTKYSGIGLAILDPDAGNQGAGPSGVGVFNTAQKLEDLVKTVSFFDEKRLIVLKNAFSAGKEIANLIKKWELGVDKQRVLVFTEDAGRDELLKKDRELFNLLSARPNIVKSFEPLEGKRLENWAKEKIESLGGKIEPEALKKLISFIAAPRAKSEAPNPKCIWRLDREINKLINYIGVLNKPSYDGLFNTKLAVKRGSSAKSRLISVADVDLLVGPEVNLNIFKVIDAIADKNRPRAAALLYNHLEAGVDPYYIFSMIVYQFRNLLRVKALVKNAVPYAGIIKKTGLNPYVVKKTFEQCKKFDLDELKRLFAALAQIEINGKSGSIDITEGLYQFIFSLNV